MFHQSFMYLRFIPHRTSLSGVLYLHGAEGKMEFGCPLPKEKTNKEHFQLNFIVRTKKKINYMT
jgi:predicted PP-loop superfamily ATPase